MMTDPSVSGDRIVFVYANDLWTSKPDGSDVMRLTSNEGNEFAPHFSPDGKTIAFTGQYDGNTDVFTIPAEGGVPTASHGIPKGDFARGFTPDGKSVLFTSIRESFARALPKFYLVPVQGGFPEKLNLPNGTYGSYSPDGKMLAYNPSFNAFTQWKHYRGGTESYIWICDMKTLSVEKIRSPMADATTGARCGSAIWFTSFRTATGNSISFPSILNQKPSAQLTQFSDFPINSAGYGAGKIVFEQAGYLHLYDPSAKNQPSSISTFRPIFPPSVPICLRSEEHTFFEHFSRQGHAHYSKQGAK